MKYRYLILSFVLTNLFFHYLVGQSSPVELNVLKVSVARTNLHAKYFKSADFYSIDEGAKSKILVDKPDFIKQNFVIRGKRIVLLLEKIEILTSGFHITTSDGAVIYPDRDNQVFYRGKISDELSSWATMSITSNEIRYMIASPEGNYEINKSSDGMYIGYFSQERIEKTSFSTHIEDQIETRIKHQHGSPRTGNCLEIYAQCDYYTYQAQGNITNTTKWVNELFGNVAAVFALHDVQIMLSGLYIYTTNDPYSSSTNLTNIRNAFVNTVQNTYNGRIAILLSQRPLGGGMSNGIGGFCNTYPAYPGPQCVTTGLSGSITPFPNYSYSTYIIAHELGHVMGLRHTHACVWNGNYTQIDDCGNVLATQGGYTAEGASCYVSTSPLIPTNGNIMSQCNEVAGSSVNLSLGFGTLPGKLLYENFIYSDCMTGISCSGVAPINDVCTKAINLPVTNTCENNTFILQAATATAGVPAFTCGNPGTVIKDIWFKLTIPTSGNVTIATNQTSGGLTDVILQAYSGSCGSLVAIACDDNSGPGNHALLTLTGRTSGEVIYIRCVDTASDNEGSFNICASDVSVACHPDFSTLVNFYNATNGPSWTNKTGWQAGAAGTNCNVCSWYGVVCNEENRVKSINLPSNNLIATSLPSSMTALTYLKELKLYNNNLSGSIPTFLNSFAYLTTVDFGGNDFTGSIPSYLGDMQTLKSLYLDNNLLSGNLPNSLTNNELSLLYVNDNNLSGCIPAGFSKFCTKAYNFSINPLLAGGISFTTYCATGDGGDEDSDGFCQALGDCNDDDNTMYPNNPEICDLKDNDCNGIIDDLAAPLTNTWIAGSGNWNLVTNWSLGTLPERCHNVVINGSNGITVTIPTGYIAKARSVTINTGTSLQVNATASLEINYGLNIDNQGTIINLGDIVIMNIIIPTLFGINNTGTINNQSSGEILVQNSGARSFSNNAGGTISNHGQITIDRHVSNMNSTGLYNFGSLSNHAQITVRNIVGNDIRIAPGSSFTNQISGTISIE